MSDATIPVLGKLIARTSLLEISGAHDAAYELCRSAISELGSMDDEGVKVTFAACLGFFSGFAMANPTPDAVHYVNLFETAARAPARPEAMRSTIKTVLNAMTAQA